MKILKSIGVVSIIEKMVKNKFRWFEHLERRLIDVVMRINQINISQTTKESERYRNT